MWSVGYSIPEDITTLKASAIADDSPFIRRFGLLSQELGMAIGITFLEANEPLPRYSIFLPYGNQQALATASTSL